GLAGLRPDGLEGLLVRPLREDPGEWADQEDISTAEQRQVAPALVVRRGAVGLLILLDDEARPRDPVKLEGLVVLLVGVLDKTDRIEPFHALHVVGAPSPEELGLGREYPCGRERLVSQHHLERAPPRAGRLSGQDLRIAEPGLLAVPQCSGGVPGALVDGCPQLLEELLPSRDRPDR